MLTTAVLVLMVASSASKASLVEEEKKAILDEHNKYRRTPQAANMREMIWDPALARHAQFYANTCNFVHNPNRQAGNFSVVGENLYVTSATYLRVASAVKSWYDEVADYTFADNSCRPGKACGHYTQIVWATSYALGCGIRYCLDLKNAGSITTGTNFICNYGPAGNFRGRQPYETGAACSACPTEAPYCNQTLCSSEDKGPGAGSILKPTWTLMLSILMLFPLHFWDC